MPKETSLRELLQKASGIRTAAVVTGKVTNASPIEITADNDAKLVLTDDDLFIPRHLTDYSVSIHLSGTIGGYSIGTHSGTIHNALKKGDEVYLLAFDNGSQYFVLDKVG